MPIVFCQDCKKSISDKAGKCPHCGCPVEPLNDKELKGKDDKLNKGCLIVMISIIAIFAILVAWPTDSKDKTPYEVAAIEFENYRSTQEIQKMMDYVMMYHGVDINDANLIKCINGLVALRKASKVGVTEMDILKHMYQNGSPERSFNDQAAYSFAVLESTK